MATTLTPLVLRDAAWLFDVGENVVVLLDDDVVNVLLVNREIRPGAVFTTWHISEHPVPPDAHPVYRLSRDWT